MKTILKICAIVLPTAYLSYYFGKGVAFAYAYDYYRGNLNE